MQSLLTTNKILCVALSRNNSYELMLSNSNTMWVKSVEVNLQLECAVG